MLDDVNVIIMRKSYIRCSKNIVVKAKTDDFDSGGDGITFPVCSTITFVLIVAVLYWGSALKSIMFVKFLIVAASDIFEEKQM